MAKSRETDPRPRHEELRETGGDNAPRHRPWTETVWKALFEIGIVAVGVFLALAVDQWRERSEQRQLANEARAALRAELLANREAVLSRLRRTAQLYVATAAHPEQVAQYVFERRNRPLQLTDAAWTMTVQTGAIRWLEPNERARIAEVYAGHERMRDVVFEELVRWTELAAFSTTTTAEARESRDRAIQVWRAFAQRAQLAQCVNVGRHERALGAHFEQQELTAFCVKLPPEEDPASIYREWKRRGWVSGPLPMVLTTNETEG